MVEPNIISVPDPVPETKKSGKVNHRTIAEKMMQQFYVKSYGLRFYEYRSEGPKIGYHVIDERQLRTDLHNAYERYQLQFPEAKDVTTSLIRGALDYIERKAFTPDSEVNKDLVYVNNGILDTRNMKLLPATPDIFVPVRINATYDPEAKCPNIDKFFKEITTDNGSKGEGDIIPHDPNDVLTLEEMVGYIFEPTQNLLRKNAFLLGPGKNGKTTYLNLLSEFVGLENISGLSIYDFSDRFSIPELHNKLVNIRDELGQDKLSSHARSLLKEIAGGSKQMQVRKMRADPFYFFCRTKLYFGCNNLPSIKMYDTAFIERWVILTLVNRYPDNQDFVKTITSPEELSGLLNKALAALIRLREQKMFSKGKSQSVQNLTDMFQKAVIPDKRVLSSDSLTSMPGAKDAVTVKGKNTGVGITAMPGAPVKAKESVKATEPAVPTAVASIVKVEEPVKVAESHKVEEPVKVTEPVKITESHKVEEPAESPKVEEHEDAEKVTEHVEEPVKKLSKKQLKKIAKQKAEKVAELDDWWKSRVQHKKPEVST
jgi:putative DNA primase/helicase